VLSKDEFVKWSKKYVLFLHLTTRVKTDKHQQMLRQKGGKGFPYLVYLNSQGTFLAQNKGKRGIKLFSDTAKEARAIQDKLDELKQKAAGGDAAAKKELFLLDLKMGALATAEAIEQAREGIDLSNDQKQLVEGKLADLTIAAKYEELRSLPRAKREAAMQETFYRWAKEGKRPVNKRVCLNFWYWSCQGAKQAKNIKLFEVGLGVLKKHFGDNRRFKRTIAKLEGQLSELKAAGN